MANETTPTAPPADSEAGDSAELDVTEDTPNATSSDDSNNPASASADSQEDSADSESATEGEAGDEASEAGDDASFDDMNLDDDVLQGLKDMGYDHPMEVQAAVYDKVAAGQDLMVQARTGTGKTAAFGIPIAQRIDAESKGAQVLILAPTRELAIQVSKELEQITRPKGLKVVPIYGGAAMGPQIDALESGAQIVSGTPGRVLDHIGRRNLHTKDIRLLILDECDEMLSMGFQEEIDKIIDTLPPREDRQTLLFSATIPAEIRRIAGRHMRDPETVSLSSDDDISVAEIDHHYYVVSGMGRTRDLLKVLVTEKPESALIFCNTKDDTNTVAKFLQRNGYNARAISSDLSQNERERTMTRMRAGKVDFLVATDVAARGIDISNLSHVINYTFPESPEVYVHRTGRTGRAGKRGVAISLVGPREIGAFYYLKLTYKIIPVERELPSNEELAAIEEKQQYERILELVPDAVKDKDLALARHLWKTPEGERVVAVLLKRLLEHKIVVQERQERGRPLGDRPERGDREGRPRRARRPREDDRGGRERGGRERGGRERGGRTGGGRTSGGRTGGGRPSGGRDAGRERGGRERVRRPRDEGRSSDQATLPRSEPANDKSAGEGKEFWETWADEKQRSNGEGGGDKPASREGGGEKTTRLYVNLGKREKITADEVRELLGEGLEDASRIGSVALRNTHCYVRVPEDLAETLIETVGGKLYKEREIVIERARR